MNLLQIFHSIASLSANAHLLLQNHIIVLLNNKSIFIHSLFVFVLQIDTIKKMSRSELELRDKVTSQEWTRIATSFCLNSEVFIIAAQHWKQDSPDVFASWVHDLARRVTLEKDGQSSDSAFSILPDVVYMLQIVIENQLKLLKCCDGNNTIKTLNDWISTPELADILRCVVSQIIYLHGLPKENVIEAFITFYQCIHYDSDAIIKALNGAGDEKDEEDSSSSRFVYLDDFFN